MLVDAREQMIEQQVRAWDVLDERILDALRAVPRERFAPASWRELAYADCELPLPCGKRMLRPMVVGRLLQAVQVRSGERVMEIGTGSGYLSACLAQLGARVRSLEIHPEIAARARIQLADVPAVEVVQGDGMQVAEPAQYDVVVLTASLPLYTPRFEELLKPGGRLFVVVGSALPQEALLIRRPGPGDSARKALFETALEALENAPRPPLFGF